MSCNFLTFIEYFLNLQSLRLQLFKMANILEGSLISCKTKYFKIPMNSWSRLYWHSPYSAVEMFRRSLFICKRLRLKIVIGWRELVTELHSKRMCIRIRDFRSRITALKFCFDRYITLIRNIIRREDWVERNGWDKMKIWDTPQYIRLISFDSLEQTDACESLETNCSVHMKYFKDNSWQGNQTSTFGNQQILIIVAAAILIFLILLGTTVIIVYMSFNFFKTSILLY